MWSFYTLATGEFTGTTYSGALDGLERNTPPGCAAILGGFDHLCQRVDLETSQVVDWQPPAPANTGDVIYAWDSVSRRWVGSLTLAALKRARWGFIKSQAMAADQQNIIVSGFEFEADATSRTELFQKVQIAIMAAQDGLGFSLTWDLADGTPVTLNANQTKAIVRAIDARTDQLKATARALRAQIMAATTPGEISAVVWP